MFLLLISYVKFHIDFQKLSERSGGFYMVFFKTQITYFGHPVKL